MVANNQRGFILASSLWVIVIVLLLAALFHGFVQSRVENAFMIQQQVRALLALSSTRNTLEYTLATRRMNLGGLTVRASDQRIVMDEFGNPILDPTGTEITVDGTMYRGLDGTYFTIRDLSGLLSLNAPGAPEFLQELLSRKFDRQLVNSLTASLGDYIDEDQRRSINGAEADEYLRKSMLPPPNYYLRSPAEIHAVMGWHDWLELLDSQGFADELAVTHANVVNLNTASPDLLQYLLGLSETEAAELVDARRRHPFRNLRGVEDEVGTVHEWNAERFRFFPGTRVEIQVWCDYCKSRIVQGIQLTPQGLYGPLLTDYIYSSTNKNRDAEGNDASPQIVVADALFTDI